ncbi:MAG: PEP-CTERM sorting domain-containing protein [Phycisphaerae bacterium]
MKRMNSALALSLLGGALLAGTAFAAPILPGVYDLANHPDGNSQPPQYGLRLDELVNVTGNHDIFTFDFDAVGSNVDMTYDDVNGIIRIYGTSLGGRDTGGAYANDVHLGFYQIDFTYNVGVQPVAGDDDVHVVANQQNFGTITAPNNVVYLLEDKSDGTDSFRLGDENNDLGHRGHPGISGWGWLNHGLTLPAPHVAASDWLFTATYRIPEPSSLALIALGAVAMLRRSR